jgi:hypothetical protein
MSGDRSATIAARIRERFHRAVYATCLCHRCRDARATHEKCANVGRFYAVLAADISTLIKSCNLLQKNHDAPKFVWNEPIVPRGQNSVCMGRVPHGSRAYLLNNEVVKIDSADANVNRLSNASYSKGTIGRVLQFFPQEEFSEFELRKCISPNFSGI